MVDTGPGEGDGPGLQPGVGVPLVQHHGGGHGGPVHVVQPGKRLTKKLNKDQDKYPWSHLECGVVAHTGVICLAPEPGVLDILPKLITVSKTNILFFIPIQVNLVLVVLSTFYTHYFQIVPR